MRSRKSTHLRCADAQRITRRPDLVLQPIPVDSLHVAVAVPDLMEAMSLGFETTVVSGAECTRLVLDPVRQVLVVESRLGNPGRGRGPWHPMRGGPGGPW